MIACPECGYDLRAIQSPRCPECGSAIDYNALSRSQIPWTHRRNLGAWRAFWRTGRLVMFRPALLADEVERPADYRDAQTFRSIVVALLTASLWCLFIEWFSNEASVLRIPWHSYTTRDWLNQVVEVAWLWPMAGIGIFLGVIIFTGIASYFFHPRAVPIVRQNSAIALSYYPTFLLVPAICFADVAVAAADISDYFERHTGMENHFVFHMADVLAGLCGCLAVLFLLWFAWCVIGLLRRTTGCSRKRQASAAAALTIGAACIPLLAVALPLATYWIDVILGT